jgi:hypothetical protein
MLRENLGVHALRFFPLSDNSTRSGHRKGKGNIERESSASKLHEVSLSLGSPYKQKRERERERERERIRSIPTDILIIFFPLDYSQ